MLELALARQPCVHDVMVEQLVARCQGLSCGLHAPSGLQTNGPLYLWRDSPLSMPCMYALLTTMLIPVGGRIVELSNGLAGCAHGMAVHMALAQACRADGPQHWLLRACTIRQPMLARLHDCLTLLAQGIPRCSSGSQGWAG